MFETLTENLQRVFQTLGRRGKLRPADVDTAMEEIRLALLEADVDYQVVEDLIAELRPHALSEQVSSALNPAQQVQTLVHQSLVRALGQPRPLELKGNLPRAIMLVGLQGSGKTTTAAKLARKLRDTGERVWLLAADPYRPAASEQLRTLGEEVGVPVFIDASLAPQALSSAGLSAAAQGGASVVILDTAGRSQMDAPLMEELNGIAGKIEPTEILLVADAMTGQEAVRIAQGFQERLALTGIVLTKMDGDARGGAAISMRTVTGLPIKYIGVGEARDALQEFDPDRLAARILGMGDIASLIERASQATDQKVARAQAETLLKGDFTFEDFAAQLAAVRSMGPIGKLLELMPSGLGGGALKQLEGGAAERQIMRVHAIIQSMTIEERRKPDILNASRKRRIAAGSGTSVQEINQLVRQFRQMRRMFKKLGSKGLGGMMPWPQ